MTLCIPEAIGVPGLIGQPPTWPGLVNGHTSWPAASPSQSTPRGLDDPRWQGHLAIGYPAIEPAPTRCCGGSAPVSSSFGTSTSEDALFRVLYDQVGADRFLYLSWWVKADDSVDHSNDELYLGLGRQVGDPLVIRVNPFSSNAARESDPAAAFTVWTTPSAGAAAGSVVNWTENGGANPSWLDANTRVWLDVASNRWAVQMRVPIGGGNVDTHVDLADTFAMWFEIAIELPDGLLAPYSWPRDACVVDACGLPSVVHVPPPAVWEDFHLRSGAGDPACPTDGFVRLSTSDVGTQNSPTSKINLVSDNVFEARPENLTGAVVSPGEITAEFRIANWGSVADPAAPWTLIPATGGSTNPSSNTGSVANGTKGSITMRWQLNPSEADDYRAGGTKDDHQCILVTLSGAHVFNPASVWRNMDFVEASTFVRSARINNLGLGPSPVPGTPRPTYILVEKLNMPAVVRPSEPGRPDQPPEPAEPPSNGDDVVIEVDAAAGRVGAMGALVKAAADLTDPEIRFELQPTIRYHVFHDTGLDVTRDGRTLRVVRPGTAFGYYVRHDGDLEGWRDELRGATEVTENFYRLEVPEEGEAVVTTVIEAVEPGTGCVDVVRLIRAIVECYVRLARRLLNRLRSLLPGS